MLHRKIKLGIARFPYAGNGGVQSEHPSIADFMADLSVWAYRDERVDERIFKFTRADTPITMTRNAALRECKKAGVDILLMIDSDMFPDVHLGVFPDVKPFWPTTFEFMYKHWDKGPCLVGAPYGGASANPNTPAHDNMFVFQWEQKSNDRDCDRVVLEQYTRNHAASCAGIGEVAAIGTGIIAIDMRVIDNPALPIPWFQYEWEDKYETAKASTEDVFFTRNCSMLGMPVYCNWDAWAGHCKPIFTGKPKVLRCSDIPQSFAEAWSNPYKPGEVLVDLNAGADLTDILPKGTQILGIKTVDHVSELGTPEEFLKQIQPAQKSGCFEVL